MHSTQPHSKTTTTRTKVRFLQPRGEQALRINYLERPWPSRCRPVVELRLDQRRWRPRGTPRRAAARRRRARPSLGAPPPRRAAAVAAAADRSRRRPTTVTCYSPAPVGRRRPPPALPGTRRAWRELGSTSRKGFGQRPPSVQSALGNFRSSRRFL